MIEKIVRLSLQQRLLVVIIALVLFVAGLLATKRLSVDAFPDVTNVQVRLPQRHQDARLKGGAFCHSAS